MHSLDTCTVVRYWSNLIQSATHFLLTDHEAKVKVNEFDSDGMLFHNAWYKFNLYLIEC